MSTTWDVIIVGAGSAGIPAAIFAGQRGARVLLVEADNRIGGTLHWSSGQISAAGSRVQKELERKVTPERAAQLRRVQQALRAQFENARIKDPDLASLRGTKEFEALFATGK